MKRNFSLLSLFRINKVERPIPLLKLTDEKVELISGRLKCLMLSKMPYLNAKYSIRAMAEEIDIPPYQLSNYLNQELGVSFNDYINGLRIEYFKILIKDAEGDRLNLSGLAGKCGFGNRNTLTAAVKKFTGFTPSSYRRGHGRYI
ncbi:helix-turn-helix domain-containing protein [Paraflavitalea pollutisoli]|uniref:helix-turn-helix domain-containing protein n=1 Tax=Paraflavitalea pollutisoli TaxID=3034143 RepID=UPI0023EACD52|nr:AraC family transcriptional regulator [Paraflavitalea sp. H1-2-19X]